MKHSGNSGVNLHPLVKQKIIGVYELGVHQVQLVLREGSGGEFYFKPEAGALPRIKVGADVDWKGTVSALLHESFEFSMTVSHCRFNPAPDYGMDHSSYLFVMTHPMFSDIAARTAEFMALSLPDLSRAYNAFRKRSGKK